MRSCLLLAYYARGVALVLVGLALARLVGISDNPAWVSEHLAAWASSFYPFSVAFFYLSMAFLFSYAGFFLGDEERDVCLLVEGASLLLVVGAGGLLVGLWLANGQITLSTPNIVSLALGITGILLAEYARRNLPKEEEGYTHDPKQDRDEPQRS